MIRLPKHPGRWFAGAVAFLLVPAVAVPYLGADGFAQPIQQGLERALGRNVDINGRVRFRLLPRPGFTAGDVVIHENPALGVEPFAYVTSLEIGVGLSSLWNRRVDLASLTLNEPSINLMKIPDGPWNVLSLLDHAAARASQGSPPPAIEVYEGRLNFKSGDLKGIFFLADTDLVVEASGSRQLSVRFSGEPARTDRTSRAFGRLTGRGSVNLAEDSRKPARLQLSLVLERTAVSEILNLVHGGGVGIGGFVTSRARLAGPIDNVAISGRLELDEFERWGWLLPGGSGWGLDFTGSLDYPSQTLDIETRAPDRVSTPLPLSVRLRATRLLADTRWASTITLRGVPLASLRTLAQETGSELANALPFDGGLTGAFSYSPARGFRGQVRVDDARLTLTGVPPLAFEDLTFLANGAELQLLPTVVRVDPGQSARIEARFTAGTPVMDVGLLPTGIQLAHLQAAWKPFTGSALPGILTSARGGILKGSLRFVRTSDEEPPNWAGDLELTGTRLTLPGIAQPIDLETATLRLKGQDLTLAITEGRYATLPFSGTYNSRGHLLALDIPEASIPQIEVALAPSLRRARGFLARTLRIGSTPVPDWLRDRTLSISLRVASLESGSFTLSNMRARLLWTGPKLDIRDFRAAVGSGTVGGSLTADLLTAEPSWTGSVQLSNFPWRDGRLEADASLESVGLAQQFLANLHLDGSYSIRDTTFPPETDWRNNSGCFTLSPGQDGRAFVDLASSQQFRRVPALDLFSK